MTAGEEVRRMPPDMIVFVPPAEPERLRRDRPHPGIEIHEHEVVPLEPGFEPDMSARRGEVPPAGEALKTFLEPERPGRQRILEPRAMARRQRLTLPGTIGNLELHLEPFTCGIRRDSDPRHQPALVVKNCPVSSDLTLARGLGCVRFSETSGSCLSH
jgi:hypothetical protein